MKILVAILTGAVVAFPTYLLVKHNAEQHSHAPIRCGERPPLEERFHA
jgi:hypothetical protein